MTTPDDDGGAGAPRPRVTRPEPERTTPRRSWATLFGRPTDGSGASPGTAAPAEDGSSEPRASETVTRAVELGYRVIDDYIRQGQKAAERLATRAWSAETALRDTQDLTARMTRHASDLVGLWLEALDTANLTGAWRTTERPGGAPEPSGGAAGVAPDEVEHAAPAAPAATSDAACGRTRIAIEIASARPAAVTVDLRSADAARPLVVHALRAVEPEKPRITEVAIEPATPDAPARLRIRVPDGQPAGTYDALVIDQATSRPVGSVSLTLSS